MIYIILSSPVNIADRSVDLQVLKKCVMAAGIKKGIIGKDDFVLKANNILRILLALLHGVKLRYAQIKIAGRKSVCPAYMGNYNIIVEK